MNVKFPLVVGSIGVTAACWGVYGPLLHWGQTGLGNNRLRAFLCVGIAYFLIAVVVPLLMMYASGGKGKWTAKGIAWSLAAGGVGAFGALGIIFALGFGGKAMYVMPLVFGCAPVVNSFWTIYWQKTWKEINAFFAAGLLLVAIGAVSVLLFAPTSHAAPGAPKVELHLPLVVLSIAVTAVCWGIYGPLLHWGQVALGGDRLRAFLCVGLAYFGIAVVVPISLLAQTATEGWTPMGAVWSLAAGAAGAIGALGIIMAFNYGGKPVYVMPLVFGCAPVVNSFWTIYWAGTWNEVGPFFAAGLILAAVGAMSVLFFAPTQHKPAGGESQNKPAKPADAAPPSNKPSVGAPPEASTKSSAELAGSATTPDSAAEAAATSPNQSP